MFNSIRLARAHSNSVFVGRPGVCLLISRGAGSGRAKWPQSGERSPTHNEAHVVRERCCASYRRRSPSPHRPLTQRSLLSLASLAWLLFPILVFFLPMSVFQRLCVLCSQLVFKRKPDSSHCRFENWSSLS